MPRSFTSDTSKKPTGPAKSARGLAGRPHTSSSTYQPPRPAEPSAHHLPRIIRQIVADEGR
jgi:hypothetical protein